MKVTVEAKLAQALAANVKKRRDGGLKKLTAWLTARSSSNGAGFVEEELMKLWKGLFYCMWMSDKPLVQEELADSISNLIHTFDHNASSFLFIESFFKTMNREWPGLDQWRMDKYMMFTRKFLTQCFVLLKKLKWSAEAVETFTALLSRTAARPEGVDLCIGFQMHVADVYVEELARVAADSISGEKLVAFFEPYCHVLSKCRTVTLREAVVKRVFEFAIRLSDPEEDEDDDDGDFEKRGNSEIQDNDEDAMQEEVYEESDDSEEDDEELDIERKWKQIVRRHELKAQELPFPKFDYKGLGDLLLEIVGKNKNCTAQMRMQSYKVVKNLHEMAKGIYPLDSLPENISENSDTDNEEEIENAVKDLNKFEEKLRQEKLDYTMSKRRRKKEYSVPMNSDDDDDDGREGSDSIEDEGNVVKKPRKPKAMRNRLKKAKKRSQQSKQSVPVEKTNSTSKPEVIKDKLMLRILQRAATEKAEDEMLKKRKSSDVTILVENKETKKPKKKTHDDDESRISAKKRKTLQEKSPPTKETIVKKNKKSNKAGPVRVPTAGDEASTRVNGCDEVITMSSVLNAEKTVEKPTTSDGTKRKGRYFNESMVSNDSDPAPGSVPSDLQTIDNSVDAPLPRTPFVSFKSFKKSPPAFFRKAVSKASPNTGKKVTSKLGFTNLPSRKVNFELAKNGAQEVKDYALSVRSSPAIPFDSGKLPLPGVLKPGLAPTPVRKETPRVKRNRKATAMEFF